MFLLSSQRLQAVATLLKQWAVIKENKVLIFADSPSAQMTLCAVLNLLGLRIRALLSRRNDAERDEILARW